MALVREGYHPPPSPLYIGSTFSSCPTHTRTTTYSYLSAMGLVPSLAWHAATLGVVVAAAANHRPPGGSSTPFPVAIGGLWVLSAVYAATARPCARTAPGRGLVPPFTLPTTTRAAGDVPVDDRGSWCGCCAASVGVVTRRRTRAGFNGAVGLWAITATLWATVDTEDGATATVQVCAALGLVAALVGWYHVWLAWRYGTGRSPWYGWILWTVVVVGGNSFLASHATVPRSAWWDTLLYKHPWDPRRVAP